MAAVITAQNRLLDAIQFHLDEACMIPSERMLARSADGARGQVGDDCLAHRRRGLRTHNGCPRSDAPAGDETILDVRVGPGEPPRHIRRFTLEQQDALVDGICERAAENQLTALLRLPCEREMLRTQRAAALQVIGHEVIEEQEVHAGVRTCAAHRAAARRSGTVNDPRRRDRHPATSAA